MTTKERYNSAKELYEKIGVDTEKAIERLASISISMHCWQGDDVTGFDNKGPLSGGIQTTGAYPGKATTPEQLMNDIGKAFQFIAGRHKINIHSSYAIFEAGEFVDRDQIKPEHFAKWVAFAKEHHIGIDFNPTLFSHPMAESNLTLSNPDKKIRDFWIRHCQACIRISEYFATELEQPCLMNIWMQMDFKEERKLWQKWD